MIRFEGEECKLQVLTLSMEKIETVGISKIVCVYGFGVGEVREHRAQVGKSKTERPRENLVL